MPRRHPHRACKRCGKSREEEGKLSARGLCLACGEAARARNLNEMVAKEGPYFEHYLRRTGLNTIKRLHAAGLLSVDDLNLRG